jgi:hypothetical protein
MNIAATSQLSLLSLWIGSTIAATLGFWTCFGACVDTPMPPSPPQARIVAIWDPLVCGAPHRVAVELEDEDGAKLAISTPCELGSLMLDAPHFGIYRGRIYAWVLGEPERSIEQVQLVVDEPIVRWNVSTPQ